MSFKEYDMYPFIQRALRRRFPAYQRWEIFPEDDWGTYRPDFVVERRNRGRTERIVVEAKLTDFVTESQISQLNRYVRNLSGPNVKIRDKIIAVPSGADTSLVPDDVSIMYLRKFWCDEDYIYYDE